MNKPGQITDMKSGVKRHDPHSETKAKKRLATQDDRSNVV
jgi:hypothetical protein